MTSWISCIKIGSGKNQRTITTDLQSNGKYIISPCTAHDLLLVATALTEYNERRGDAQV